MRRLCWSPLLAAGMLAMVAHADEKPLAARVLVIGHRGAPARQPEHTLASYA